VCSTIPSLLGRLAEAEPEISFSTPTGVVLAVAVVLVLNGCGLKQEHTREHMPSFCEQLHKELNQVQKCWPDESTQPVAVEV
jgi:hypothetical protein